MNNVSNTIIFKQGYYDLLNGKQAYFPTEDIAKAFECVYKSVEFLLCTALKFSFFHPANCTASVIQTCKVLKVTPYNIPNGTYGVVFNELSYCIVQCVIIDGIKSIHAIECVSNKVVAYYMCDGEQNISTEFSIGLCEIAIAALSLYAVAKLPKFVLKDSGKDVTKYGYTFRKHGAWKLTIADYKNAHQVIYSFNDN